MLMFDIPFGTTDWTGVERTEHAGETGKAYWRTRNFNNIRVRMVEYTPGYLADHWCQKGHVLLVLEGELHTELADADAWRKRTGGRVFAATNQEHHRAAYLRDRAGLGAHFDEIIYSAALGVCKPDRVFFTTAQTRMGVSAAQSILFVDDEPPNVDGARMAGWRDMLYRGPESLAQALEKWG